MCTLIVLHRCVAGEPLIVAANRDEFLARPAEDFAVRSSRTGPILSPLDLEAGGTWVGLSERGVFAGLTNLRPLSGALGQSAAPAADLRSRGDVVMAALEAESATTAVRTLQELDEAAYNPFQLLVADGRDAYLIVYRDVPRVVELAPGPHIVGNVEEESIALALGTAELLAAEGGLQDATEAYPGFEGIEGLHDPQTTAQFNDSEPRALKLTRIRECVEKMMTEPEADLFEGLAGICREHEDGEGIQSPFEATCVHIPGPASLKPGETTRYGTRSSLLLSLSEDEGSSRLWATDGPPCERPYENRSSLLKDLGVRLGSPAGPVTT